MVHSMHTLLQAAFGCFSSLQATCDVLARNSHILIEAQHAVWSANWNELTIYRPTGLGDVTAVTH